MSEPTTVTTVEENDAASTTGKSAAELKREYIRMKYGLREKDQEYYRKTKDEDIEEFESVDAISRPATTKMRTAKLRWKDKDPKDTYFMTCGHDKGALKSLSDTSDDMFEDMIEGEIHYDTRIADIKRKVGISRTNGTEKNNEYLNEMRILLTRIEDLELINRKLVLEVRRLKKALLLKEKKIEELTPFMCNFKKAALEESEEKLTSEQEAIAIRGLEIMKRNQLLEHSVRSTERTILSKFFEAADPKPTHSIVVLIDKAFTYAIEAILMRPDRFDDFVDNDLRVFLLDTQKAKRILLEVMLLHPQYVPRTWGGDVLVKRQREIRQSAIEKQKPVAINKGNGGLIKSYDYGTLEEDLFDPKLKNGMNNMVKLRGKKSLTPSEKNDLKTRAFVEKNGFRGFKAIDNKNGNASTEKKYANEMMESREEAVARIPPKLRAFEKSMEKTQENLSNFNPMTNITNISRESVNQQKQLPTAMASDQNSIVKTSPNPNTVMKKLTGTTNLR
ncbi:hypothetical protein DICVIV_08665 [Dictyocaulus viviparus]|uniref:DUF7774 domain-containing protein n=1 Tax=Dictyocaulus viviparus TaxID=29172 RepID=A0A0D8XND0_DICVI|nr:hypothetical protein DICVIV_08665 [Dictyocaulus viviparus]